MSLDDALRQGDFASAVRMLEHDLRSAPDPNKLFLLVELKGYLEDFDGADADLRSLEALLPGRGYLEEIGPILANARVWCYRQTVADFKSRRAALSVDLRSYSVSYGEAVWLHARGESKKAQHQLDRARREVSPAPGELTRANGETTMFSELWDADDLTGPHLTCSHPRGLLDIPFADIAEVEFFPVHSFVDSIWKPARVRTWRGEQILVRVYAYYVGTAKHKMELVRQCRLTVFDDKPGYRVAYGQRDWQMDSLKHQGGMSLVGIASVKNIRFHNEAA
jgi:protein involved in temperature-dependent protein secretion